MRVAAMPRAIKAAVTTPVPGPSSRIGPLRSGSICSAMARANSGLDGAMAPTLRGRANSPRRNRNCSSKGVTSTLVTIVCTRFRAGSSRLVTAGPEVLELGEKTLGLGMRALFAPFVELAQQFLLALGQL